MAVSAAGSPVSLHSGDGFFFAHSCHVSFAKPDLHKKQVDEISRKRLRGGLGRAAVRFLPVLDARPERCLIDVELISEDVSPQALTVSLAVYRVGNPRSQDPPVMELELVGDMMRAGLAPRVPYWLPAFSFAEGLMGLAGRRRPGHRADPVSQSRSCSSLLRVISWTRPQFSRWLGACRRRSCQSSAYSRSASAISVMASSKVPPSAAIGRPGMNTDHPPASWTTWAWKGTTDARKCRRSSASRTTAVAASRRTVATWPFSAASSRFLRLLRASV